MKKILMLVVALMALGSVEVEGQQDLAELEYVDGVYFKYGFFRRNTLVPYSGDVIKYHYDQIVVRGSLRNGRWHGPYERAQYFSDEGLFISREKGRYDNGKKCGVWIERESPDLLTELWQICGPSYRSLGIVEWVNCNTLNSKEVYNSDYPAC